MIKEAIILAGGLGTRLKTLVPSSPKSMALVNGRPFLEYQLESLAKQKIEKVVLAVCYKKELIQNHFNTSYKQMDIVYSVENVPLGTGGAVRKALILIENEDVLVLNGDSLFLIDLHSFYLFYRHKKAKICIAIKRTKDVSRFGCVEVDESHRIISFNEKPDQHGINLINGGYYILNKSFYLNSFTNDKFSIEKDVFEKIIGIEPVFGMISQDYFIDIGIPEDFTKAQDDFRKL